jgi:hypothetical protein
VRTSAAEQALVPAAARFDVAAGNQRLRSHVIRRRVTDAR